MRVVLGLAESSGVCTRHQGCSHAGPHFGAQVNIVILWCRAKPAAVHGSE